MSKETVLKVRMVEEDKQKFQEISNIKGTTMSKLVRESISKEVNSKVDNDKLDIKVGVSKKNNNILPFLMVETGDGRIINTGVCIEDIARRDGTGRRI